MHEASLIVDLMRRIDGIAKAEGARRIVGVSVWLGALSHMSAEHFAEHFKRAAAGTVAAGAWLDVCVSDDLGHANAQDLVLKSVAVES
ncbi:MAG TPA: hydrogenase/urease maturation nickel metallochaperone HypA [Xanthobacteraceae bacterium]|jgi:hydrogenase nickel incorporation protein HypA/HybF|nr:hydrogenase/urease maturation nickel metallochaperone HypA [Xanthobacteraceae bacterium]